MTQQEFVHTLGEELQDYMPIEKVRENVRYYKEYIEGEVASGRSEKDVLDELGDPRLIARTILDAGGYSDTFQGETVQGSYENTYRSDSYDSGYRGGSYEETYGSDPYSGGRSESFYGETGGPKIIRFDKWYQKLALIAVIVLVIVVIVSIVTGVLTLLIRFAGPILLILLVVGVIRYILRG